MKNDFFSMLSEASKLTPNSQWKKVKGIFQKDGRYQAVDGSSQREEYYNEYLKQLGKVSHCVIIIIVYFCYYYYHY